MGNTAKGVFSSLFVRLEAVFACINEGITKFLRGYFCPDLRGIELGIVITPTVIFFFDAFIGAEFVCLLFPRNKKLNVFLKTT